MWKVNSDNLKLIKYGKLENDNRKYVYAFTDSFKYGNETKVILEIEDKEWNYIMMTV